MIILVCLLKLLLMLVYTVLYFDCIAYEEAAQLRKALVDDPTNL